MVFDVVTRKFRATGCMVAEMPKVGDIFTYDTFPAEFVATSAGLAPLMVESGRAIRQFFRDHGYTEESLEPAGLGGLALARAG